MGAVNIWDPTTGSPGSCFFFSFRTKEYYIHTSYKKSAHDKLWNRTKRDHHQLACTVKKYSPDHICLFWKYFHRFIGHKISDQISKEIFWDVKFFNKEFLSLSISVKANLTIQLLVQFYQHFFQHWNLNSDKNTL